MAFELLFDVFLIGGAVVTELLLMIEEELVGSCEVVGESPSGGTIT